MCRCISEEKYQMVKIIQQNMWFHNELYSLILRPTFLNSTVSKCSPESTCRIAYAGLQTFHCPCQFVCGSLLQVTLFLSNNQLMSRYHLAFCCLAQLHCYETK